MTVHELSREQLTELKGSYLCEKNNERGEGTSWGELADADSLVSDEEIFKEYEGTEFTNDDFSCTAGQEEPSKFFDSVADCLNYLADEGYLCGGDSIEFIAPDDDSDDIEEVHTYGACHNLISTYRIRH